MRVTHKSIFSEEFFSESKKANSSIKYNKYISTNDSRIRSGKTDFSSHNKNSHKIDLKPRMEIKKLLVNSANKNNYSAQEIHINQNRLKDPDKKRTIFTSTPYEINFMDEKDGFFINAKKRQDIGKGGFFDVISHGDTKRIFIKKDTPFSASVAANIIKYIPAYKEHQPIRLLSCKTGQEYDGFAQNLADLLDTIVKAPTNTLWAYPNGKMIVAPKLHGSNGDGIPDIEKTEDFELFYPQKWWPINQ